MVSQEMISVSPGTCLKDTQKLSHFNNKAINNLASKQGVSIDKSNNSGVKDDTYRAG